MRVVDPVQHQIGEGDGIDQGLFLPAVEGLLLQLLVVVGVAIGGLQGPLDELVGLGQEATGSTAGVVDGFTDPRGEDLDDDTGHHPGGEELAAVIVLLPHLQQQALIDLRQGEDVGLIDPVLAQRIDLVEHVAEIALGVDPRPLHPAHDLADELLPDRRPRLLFQGLQVRDEVLIDEAEKRALRRLFQFRPFRTAWCPPIAPAVGRRQ